jgi:hypothetical protein
MDRAFSPEAVRVPRPGATAPGWYIAAPLALPMNREFAPVTSNDL